MKQFCAFVAAAALCLTLTSCGTDDPAPRDQSTSSPAPSLPKVDLPDDLSALSDLSTKKIRAMPSVRMTAKTRVGDTEGATITASLGRSGDRPAASLRFEESPDGTLQVVNGRMIGGTFYMRDPNSDAAPGKPWLRLSPDDVKDPRLGKYSKVFRTALSGLAGSIKQATGASDIATIRSGSRTGKPAEEKLNGVAVRHYSGTTDLAKLSDGQHDKVVRALGEHGLHRVPWDLWIDHTGLPRKFMIKVKVPKRGALSATTTYTDWGTPINVTAPPDDKVVGLADLGRS